MNRRFSTIFDPPLPVLTASLCFVAFLVCAPVRGTAADTKVSNANFDANSNADASHAPASSHAASKRKAAALAPGDREKASYLDAAVAIVNGQAITRREFVLALIAAHPVLLGEAAQRNPPPLHTLSDATLTAQCKQALTYNLLSYDSLIQNLMLLRALEDAARARHCPVSETEIQQRMHSQLDLRRRAEEIPADNDADILRHLGATREAMRDSIKLVLLGEHLTLADLDARLGHAAGPNDFFSAHYLFLAARKDNKTATQADLDAARTRLENLRERILHKELSFEQAAAQNSDDATRLGKGALGALPRTLMKPDMETPLLALQPGEITPPLRVNNGYGIARLDKRGAALTDGERAHALRLLLTRKKRTNEVLLRVLQNVRWENLMGSVPGLAAYTVDAP